MKAFVLLSLFALSLAAPQPRKIFHEHFFDFMDVIQEESGHEIQHLMEHYNEFEEFRASLEYLSGTDFKQLVYEMESLPEFNAVMDFLENHNIDIHYFIDSFNEMIENGPTKRSQNARHHLSGTDFSSFIRDSIAVFPKDRLAALYEQKMEEDEEFKLAMENFDSAEWHEIFGNLWDNEVFQKEVEALMQRGINIHVLFAEIKAVFGQN